LNEIHDVLLNDNKIIQNKILNFQTKIFKIEDEHRIELKVYQAKIRSSEYEQQLAIDDLLDKGQNKQTEEDEYNRDEIENYNSYKAKLIQKYTSLDTNNQEQIRKVKEDED